MAITDLELSTRLLFSAVGPVLIVAWVWFVVAAARPGAARVVRFLPLVPALMLFASIFRVDDPNESTLQMIAGIVYLWMVPSKILCFAMNRGQLVKSYDCGNVAAFALGMLGQITIAFDEKPIAKESETEKQKCHAYKDVRFSVIQLKGKAFLLEIVSLVSNIAAKVGTILCVRKVYFVFANSGHFFWRDVCLGCVNYCSASAVQDIYALMVLLPTSLKLVPSFNRPFLAQSMRDFWARRYNLVMGECLRDLIYDPICEGCWVRGSTYYDRERPSKAHKVIGTILTFGFSGFIHTVVLRYLSQDALFIRCGFFFVACSFVIVAEVVINHFIQSSNALKSIAEWVPSWLWMIYTVLTASYMGHILFWPDFHEAGFTSTVLDGVLRMLYII